MDSINNDANTALQEKGKEAAIHYLISQNYEILEQDWKCGFGKIDIIAQEDNGTIAFINVETRKNIKEGMPEELDTAKDRSTAEKIAMCYMMCANVNNDTILRFDKIAICIAASKRAMLRHHKSWFCN